MVLTKRLDRADTFSGTKKIKKLKKKILKHRLRISSKHPFLFYKIKTEQIANHKVGTKFEGKNFTSYMWVSHDLREHSTGKK